jgi:hypothetical protein
MDVAGIDAPPNRRSTSYDIKTKTRPIWYQLATPEERSKIDDLDRSIAELRRARQVLVNRAKLRTHVGVERRAAPVTNERRE